MELVTLTQEHLDILSVDILKSSKEDIFYLSANMMNSEVRIQEYFDDTNWVKFAMVNEGELYGTVAYKLKEGIQLSRAFILVKHRNKLVDGKKTCSHLVELILAHVNGLYPVERKWCISYEMVKGGAVIPNKGLSCWLEAGFVQESREDMVRESKQGEVTIVKKILVIPN